MIRQLLYISSSVPDGAPIDIQAIVQQSRHNNALDGVTGLLYTDARRFLQVLEGPAESVGTTFARIRQDPRHRAIVILHDRMVEAREFGDWSMAARDAGEQPDAFDANMERALAAASPSVRGTFLGLVATREAPQRRRA